MTGADERHSDLSQSERQARAQLSLMRDNMPFVFGGTLVVASIVTLLQWNSPEFRLAVYWFGTVVLLTVFRALLEWGPLRQLVNRLPVTPQAMALYAFNSSLSGMLWGALAWLLLDNNDPVSVAFYILVLAGMTAGSLVSLSAILPVYWAYAIPAMGPLIVILWQSQVIPSGGPLTLAFLVVNLGYSRVLSQSYRESIRQRFENLDLVAALSRQTALAEQANLAKSRFLAAASHDLRQPLAALELFLGALKDGLHEPGQQRVLEQARRSSENLKGLLDALLDISRLDAQVVEPQLRAVDLRELLDELFEEFQPQVQQKSLEFRIAYSGQSVRSDPILLARLLRNLLSNALRYTPEGEVTVDCKHSENGRVHLSVCDTGIGIAPEDHAAVFEEFRQLDNPARDRSQGLGLGLAIVLRLSKLLGHPLEMESEPGKGTCFHLFMTPAAALPPMPARSMPVSGGWRGRVLVIDDEADVREALQTICRGWDMEVYAAAGMDEAEALLADGRAVPELLICDYRLGEGHDGIMVAERIRRLRNGELKVLILTGDTGPEQIAQIHTSGLPVLSKPVSADHLQLAIQEIMR